MKSTILLLVTSAVGFGQVTPTRIGKHQMGETLEEWYQLEPNVVHVRNEIMPHHLDETFAEWLERNNLDLPRICGKHDRSDHTIDYKAVCRNLLAIQSDGIGESYTVDRNGRRIGWKFFGGTLSQYQLDGQGPWKSRVDLVLSGADSIDKDSLVTASNNRRYIWRFASGKLIQVSVGPDHDSRPAAFSDEVAFLGQIYGSPAAKKSNAFQNAMGAHWERTEVTWHAPDGTTIMASEASEFDEGGLLGQVVFVSKTAPLPPGPSGQNPYKE